MEALPHVNFPATVNLNLKYVMLSMAIVVLAAEMGHLQTKDFNGHMKAAESV